MYIKMNLSWQQQLNMKEVLSLHLYSLQYQNKIEAYQKTEKQLRWI